MRVSQIQISFLIICTIQVLGVIIPNRLNAQEITYFNYLNYTSKWYYRMSWFGIGGYSGNNHDYLYITGDTLIDGNSYYKVMRHNFNEQINPTYGTSESDEYAYALREDADSLFTYKYPDGTTEMFSNKASDWPGNRVEHYGGEIPHRVYWHQYHPVQGWIEGIGEGQIGATSYPYKPYEPGSFMLECYIKDTLSTTYAYTTCEIDFFTTAVKNSTPLESVYVYPNPANDELYLAGLNSQVVDLKLYSMIGTLLHTFQNIQGNLPIDIEGYAPGMYFLIISSGDNIYSCKFLITN